MNQSTLNLDEWYSANQAAEQLSIKSGKKVNVAYPRKLASYKKIRTLRISPNTSLYYKEDVDNYTVEDRGVKSGRARHEKYLVKREQIPV